MNKIIFCLKEFSGGQNLTPRQRVIFMWWALSLTFTVIFGECLTLCALCVVSFAVSSHYLKKEVPVPKDESEEI